MIQRKGKENKGIFYDKSDHLFRTTTASTMLARKVDLGVHDAQMASERIITRERLLLDAQRAPHFLLARIVNRIFVPGEIVGP